MSRLRALIIGGGWMGQLHAESLAELGVEVVALVEPSIESATAFTAKFAVPTFATVDQGLSAVEADLACVCTPSGLHAAQTVLALQAGCHVVVEKPIATTVADAQQMTDAAKRSGRTLSVILQYRFNRDAVALHRAVQRGLFGDILFANVINYISRDRDYFAANGGWRATWALNGGGILINQSTHGMDLLDWCMGPITEAKTLAATRVHAVDVEDTLTSAISFASGAQGVVQVTSATNANHPLRLEIVGTLGRAVFERARLSEWSIDDDPAKLLTDDELALLPPAPADSFGEPFGVAHRRQFQAIVDALRADRRPPVAATEAIGSLRTIAMIYASSGLPPVGGSVVPHVEANA